MDTSETYIKMCDCEEIQGQWEPSIGDYIGGDWFIDQEDNIGKTFLGIIRRLKPEGKDDCVDCGGDIFWAIESNIWLPRQDQLQEMVGKYDLPNLLVEFYCFVSGRVPLTNEIVSEPKWAEFTSMEQLWLAFVMKEKYNKTWDGEEWKSV